VDPVTASDPSNYTFSGGSVLGASMGGDGRTVTLTTAAQQHRVLYTLQANGVRDVAAAANIGNSSRQYTYSDVGGMVGYYRLDGASQDTSGYAHDGQAHGSPAGIGGQFEGAMHFDGAGDYIEIDDADVLDGAFSDAFTVAAWVSPDDVPAYTTASNRAYAVFTSPNMSIEYDTNQRFRVRLKTSAGEVSITTAGTFAPGQWRHVAAAVDDGNHEMAFFIDGELVGGAPVSLSGLVTPPESEDDEIAWMDSYYDQYRIGVNDPLFDYEMNYFKGGIDEVYLFNRALDAGEIAQVIPEPATLVLLALGGLAVVRRRR